MGENDEKTEGVQESAETAELKSVGPAKKSHTDVRIGIAAIIVVALLVGALVVLMPYAPQSPLVGKWHLTRMESIIKVNTTYNTTENHTINQYIEFRADGTGYIYSNETEPTMLFYEYNITWRDRGDGRVEITHKQEDVTTTVTMNYTVDGDNITLSYRTKIIQYKYSMEIKETIYGERVENIPAKPDHIIGYWHIEIDGSPTKVIHATTQGDGTATWSGWVNVTVYDEDSNPLPHVKVSLNGCGVTENETTNSRGLVNFYLNNVTLPSGVQQDEITVKMQYRGMSETDSIIVVRV